MAAGAGAGVSREWVQGFILGVGKNVFKDYLLGVPG